MLNSFAKFKTEPFDNAPGAKLRSTKGLKLRGGPGDDSNPFTRIKPELRPYYDGTALRFDVIEAMRRGSLTVGSQIKAPPKLKPRGDTRLEKQLASTGFDLQEARSQALDERSPERKKIRWGLWLGIAAVGWIFLRGGLR